MKFELPSFLKRKTAAEKIAAREAAKAAPATPKVKLPAVDLRKIAEDFKTLDPKDPGLWPLVPKVVILIALFAGLIGAAWLLGWNVQLEELEQKASEESTLKEDWLKKKKQAVNLDEHKLQLVEINNSFGVLLKQLPNQSEMGDLLVDVNKAAQSRGLLVELFKPAGEQRKEFYAEVPVQIQLTGTYHDMGSFAGDVALLPRIVTLNDVDLSAGPNASLSFKATAKTFRYLDDNEVANARKAQKAGGK